MCDFWHFWDQMNRPYLRGIRIIEVSIRRRLDCTICSFSFLGVVMLLLLLIASYYWDLNISSYIDICSFLDFSWCHLPQYIQFKWLICLRRDISGTVHKLSNVANYKTYFSWLVPWLMIMIISLIDCSLFGHHLHTLFHWNNGVGGNHRTGV